MRFKKINDNVIKCVVTKEEMYEYGLEVSELVDNRDKAEDFLRRVMQEARYELDYKTNGGALSVQIAMLPDGDVAMTIAEASPDKFEGSMDRLKSYLEDFTKLMGEKNISFDPETIKGSEETPVKPKKPEVGDTIKKISNKSYLEALAEPIWIRCANMDVCFELSKILSTMPKMGTSLYNYRGELFLRLVIPDYKNYPADYVGDFLLTICEYGEELFMEEQGARVIYEHGKVIIAKEAIETLANL